MDSFMKSPKMDNAFLVSKPKYFTLKKWTLVIFMAFQILFMIGGMIFVDRLLKFATDQYPEIPADKIEENKEIMKITVYIIYSLGILLELFFIWGTLKHNICSVTTFAVLIILGAIYALFLAFRNHIFWFNFITASVISLISILYIRDLRFIRMYMHSRKRLRQEV